MEKAIPEDMNLETRLADDQPSTYVARIRFKVNTLLNISSDEYCFSLAGRDVVLSAQNRGSPILQSAWLVMRVTGFGCEDDARTFGAQLKTALEVASIANRMGIDTGIDVASSGISTYLRDQFASYGLVVKNDVHGLDVYPDFKIVKFASASGSLVVRMPPEPILKDVEKFFTCAGNESQLTKDIVLLLNHALMQEDPVSQIVFAISAVEMLGQDEAWSKTQEAMLEELASQAETIEHECNQEERVEIAEAIRKSIHKIGLRQGVMRLLRSLELAHLKKEWDTVYGLRSKLVHGLAPVPGADYSSLANRVLNLCGTILLQAVEREISGASLKSQGIYRIENKPTP